MICKGKTGDGGKEGEGERRDAFQAPICGKFASLSFDWHGRYGRVDISGSVALI